MKPLIPFAALLLASCATLDGTDLKRGLTLSRAAHANLCESVERYVKTGEPIGPITRKSIDLCVSADVALDGAQAAYDAGRADDAANYLTKAQGLLKTLREIAL